MASGKAMKQWLAPIIAAIEEEGVTHELCRRGKGNHPYLLLTFRGVTRKSFFPGTPSDTRGQQNKLSQVKAVIKEMKDVSSK